MNKMEKVKGQKSLRAAKLQNSSDSKTLNSRKLNKFEQNNTIQYNTIQYNTVQHNATRYKSRVALKQINKVDKQEFITSTET